jgi:hypothetical protein
MRRGKLRIGVHSDVAVTAGEGEHRPVVSQAFCSALPVAYTSMPSAQWLDLRGQQGVRIGVVISDETTMIFAPVSRNVEAGSTTEEKSNAVLLCGPATERLAQAIGIAEGESEIGRVRTRADSREERSQERAELHSVA